MTSMRIFAFCMWFLCIYESIIIPLQLGIFQKWFNLKLKHATSIKIWINQPQNMNLHIFRNCKTNVQTFAWLSQSPLIIHLFQRFVLQILILCWTINFSINQTWSNNFSLRRTRDTPALSLLLFISILSSPSISSFTDPLSSFLLCSAVTWDEEIAG